MPKIAERKSYGGADERLTRLGLDKSLWAELENVLDGFVLKIAETKDGNGGAAVRKMIDAEFEKAGGWKKSQTGDVDWVKCHKMNGGRGCIGVEIQISGRSDLLIIDVAHLREQIVAGDIDVGVIVVPSDDLAYFLTDRGANWTSALQAVERAKAEDMPIVVIGIEHDGIGPALAKQKKRRPGT